MDPPSLSGREIPIVFHSHSVSLWRVEAFSLAATSVTADLASTGQAALDVCNCGEGQAGFLQVGLVGGSIWGRQAGVRHWEETCQQGQKVERSRRGRQNPVWVCLCLSSP